MIRYIKSPNLTYSQPTGVSLDDPIGWTDVVTESNTYSTSNDSTNLWRYFAIKLNAGTKYTIKQTARSFDTAFWLYNSDKSVITSVDSDSPSSPSSDGRIDNDSSNETFYYTPSVAGVYYLCWGAYSSGTGTATIEITPKPEIYTLSEPTIVPSIGIDKWGFPIYYSDLKSAYILYKKFPYKSAPDDMTSNENDVYKITASSQYDTSVAPFNCFSGIPPKNNLGWHSASDNPKWIGWQNKIEKVLVKN